jgi:hypothetical protein
MTVQTIREGDVAVPPDVEVISGLSNRSYRDARADQRRRVYDPDDHGAGLELPFLSGLACRDDHEDRGLRACGLDDRDEYRAFLEALRTSLGVGSLALEQLNRWSSREHRGVV